MEKSNVSDSSEPKTRDLNEYAAQMGKFVTELKTSIKNMSDTEVSMMIEENKVCKAMFQQVFNVLVTEKTVRINQASEIANGLKELDV